jgi:Protein of unknown function (DUF1579)
MKREPQSEHHWLQALLGEWSFEAEMVSGSDQPATKSTGSETVRSIGGLWTIGESQGSSPDGTPTTGIMTLGYDPQKKRFVGTFIASMMTHLWIYDGALDATGKVLTLDTEGPNFSGDGKLARYQDIIELKSHDHRLLRSRMRGDDGKWHDFMIAHYRRRKRQAA